MLARFPARWQERWRAPGGPRELLALALPLIVSNSFWTLQITIDRVLLGWQSSDAVGAAMQAAMFFWTPLALLQNTAGYCTTFVAQYTGAGRDHRVGPSVWQALWFSLISGLLFLGFVPAAPILVGWAGHSATLQELETIYFQCLCFSALPTILTAAVSGFFNGRGDSWTVMVINAVGLVVNALLDYAWIGGHWGFPAWGIAGAGWATVVGCWASAVLGLVLMLQPRFRAAYATLSGWRIDRDLFGRLLYFGLPSGLQWALDGLAFTFFIIIVGWLGDEALNASSVAFTCNLVAVLPALGIGQAVGILVGQRLGEDRPDLAERSTWTGFGVAWLYMSTVAMLYVTVPGFFLWIFQSGASSSTSEEIAKWATTAALVPGLLRFVAIYSLFDSINLVFSFALRGAGDTLFVTVVALGMAWPLMVLPSYAAWSWGWGLWWAWAFASAYIIALALIFLLRFRQGKWKSMRVIEAVPRAE